MNQELKRAVKNVRLKGIFQRGLLGDFEGQLEVAGRTGYYYVRLEKPGGYEVGIFPGRVRPLYNLPVRIETHPLTNQQFIAGTDDETIAYGGAAPGAFPALDRHADTHGWGGDDMAMWLHTQQIFPLRCQPHATEIQSVQIQAGTYFAMGVFRVLDAPLSLDLSAEFPASGAVWVLLYLDGDATPGIVNNGATSLKNLGVAPEGGYWCAAVRLAAGAGIGWQDIVDLRFLNAGVLNAILSEREILTWMGW